jgi:hypothetical protein
MAELVDALVLGTSVERRGGSSPLIRTSLRVGKASGSGSQTVNLIRSRGRIDTSLAHHFNADVTQW